MSGQKSSALAHAKVNLHLGVGPQREDGYHELVTVFQSLSLADVVTLEPHTTGEVALDAEHFVTGLHAYGRSHGVPEDSTNLAWRAVQLVYEAHLARGGRPCLPVAIHLSKQIPVAGGMAGGSADAAAALRAADALLRAGLSSEELHECAARLGSDVPFTLVGQTQLGTGRGERLAPVLSRGTYWWVLAVSKVGLSTPEVFRKYDELGGEAHLDTEPLLQALMTGDPARVAPTLHNDLQAAAMSLRPELRRIIAAGERAGALRGIVSGSGPTCAFLCESEESAEEVAAELADAHLLITAVSSGPAPGAVLRGA